MMANLVRIVKNHGVSCKVIAEKLLILDQYSKDGEHFEEWIEAPKTVKELYSWLGY